MSHYVVLVDDLCHQQSFVFLMPIVSVVRPSPPTAHRLSRGWSNGPRGPRGYAWLLIRALRLDPHCQAGQRSGHGRPERFDNRISHCKRFEPSLLIVMKVKVWPYNANYPNTESTSSTTSG
ncbi:unnamed protein product, partial [Nesidiocoris tenuis]